MIKNADKFFYILFLAWVFTMIILSLDTAQYINVLGIR